MTENINENTRYTSLIAELRKLAIKTNQQHESEMIRQAADVIEESTGVTQPCPFCRSTDTEITRFNDGKCRVECKTCNALGPDAANKIEANRLWSTRG